MSEKEQSLWHVMFYMELSQCVHDAAWGVSLRPTSEQCNGRNITGILVSEDDRKLSPNANI